MRENKRNTLKYTYKSETKRILVWCAENRTELKGEYFIVELIQSERAGVSKRKREKVKAYE